MACVLTLLSKSKPVQDANVANLSKCVFWSGNASWLPTCHDRQQQQVLPLVRAAGARVGKADAEAAARAQGAAAVAAGRHHRPAAHPVAAASAKLLVENHRVYEILQPSCRCGSHHGIADLLLILWRMVPKWVQPSVNQQQSPSAGTGFSFASPLPWGR